VLFSQKGWSHSPAIYFLSTNARACVAESVHCSRNNEPDASMHLLPFKISKCSLHMLHFFFSLCVFAFDNITFCFVWGDPPCQVFVHKCSTAIPLFTFRSLVKKILHLKNC